ncbi:MAG: hypothetical protein Kow0032_25890 [Methyloligellaceae bacterium]
MKLWEMLCTSRAQPVRNRNYPDKAGMVGDRRADRLRASSLKRFAKKAACVYRMDAIIALCVCLGAAAGRFGRMAAGVTGG